MSCVIFHCHLVRWFKLEILAVCKLSDFMWVYAQAIKQEKVYTQRQLKLTNINLAILNRNVTVTYLRFIKNSYFYAIKQTKKNKINSCIGFFSNKKTVKIKWHLSKNLTFRNLLRKQKTINCLKIEILAFNKEFTRKLLSTISEESFNKNNLYMTLALELS